MTEAKICAFWESSNLFQLGNKWIVTTRAPSWSCQLSTWTVLISEAESAFHRASLRQVFRVSFGQRQSAYPSCSHTKKSHTNYKYPSLLIYPFHVGDAFSFLIFSLSLNLHAQYSPYIFLEITKHVIKRDVKCLTCYV